MGDRSFEIATTAGIALVTASVLFAPQASSQSLSDRFKSLFGVKSDEPAQNTPPPAAAPEPDLNCPPVTVRAGASTYAVAAPGKEAAGNEVKFQASITKTARECIK
ncbi:MAG: hypothetical protein JO283_16230, partial [Bradyrhizobium sp.]|nr:hypothetical protein [Bradyrhizobium sp.]